MTDQGRNQGGKFIPKSSEPRFVRSMRLTNSTWEKLGSIAAEKGLTRADLLEEWAAQNFCDQDGQLTLFRESEVDLMVDSSKEVITADTRKTGTELARRFTLSSAALTNWLKEGSFLEKSKHYDPDDIPWEREPGKSKKYRPIL